MHIDVIIRVILTIHSFDFCPNCWTATRVGQNLILFVA